jgi:hypothetical protein
MYSLYPHGLFFIFSYKILKPQIVFSIFPIRLESTRVTQDKTPWLGQPQIGFDNYGCHENIYFNLLYFLNYQNTLKNLHK